MSRHRPSSVFAPASVRGRRVVLLCFAFELLAAQSSGLEPRSLTEPNVLREPAQVTRVVDAFDAEGAFDLHFTLAYQQRWKRGKVLRETQNPLIAPTGTSGIAAVEVANYVESTSRLNVRADIGIFRDLALIVRAPIILSRSTELEDRGAGPGALDGALGEPLFELPFRSPNRSGVEFLGLGVDWGVLNQWRDSVQPTVLVGAEARFSISEQLHACGSSVPAPAPGTVRCAYPADMDRDGQSGEFPADVGGGQTISLEGEFPNTARQAGVSRGTTGLELHAVVSRRFQITEPYVGFNLLYEIPHDSAEWGAGEPWNSGPPVRGGFSVGAEIMPWEVVEHFQRLSIDLRFSGTYVAEGRNYSELFDALGSASGAAYRSPNFARYTANPDPATAAEFPSVVDPTSERVFPTGSSQIEAHGSYALRVTARWQAGPYVHFDLGGALELTQRHMITGTARCDAARAVDLTTAGPCVATEGGERVALGAPDPNFRPEIDLPGRRFIMDTMSTVDAWVGATVMF